MRICPTIWKKKKRRIIRGLRQLQYPTHENNYNWVPKTFIKREIPNRGTGNGASNVLFEIILQSQLSQAKHVFWGSCKVNKKIKTISVCL
jgi:hypothetical protein